MRETETQLTTSEDSSLPLTPLGDSFFDQPSDSQHSLFLPVTPSLSPALSTATAQQTRKSSHEIQPNENGQFQCDFPNCTKSFWRNFALTRHKKIHVKVKVKPFCCDFSGCEKRFTEKHNKKKHMKLCKYSNLNLVENIQQSKQKSPHNNQEGINQTKSVEKDSNNNNHITQTMPDHLTETIQLCSTPSEEIIKSPSAPIIFDDRTLELSITSPFNPIPQTPFVTETNISDIFQPFSPLSIPWEIKNLLSTPSISLGTTELPEINPSVSWPQPEGDIQSGSSVTTRQKRKSSHEIKPNENRKFQCDFPECTKSFVHNFVLTRHKKVHATVKPFCCDFDGCEKAFTEKQNKQRHMKSCKFSKVNLDKNIQKLKRKSIQNSQEDINPISKKHKAPDLSSAAFDRIDTTTSRENEAEISKNNHNDLFSQAESSHLTDIFPPFSPFFIPGEIENLPSTPSISLGTTELPVPEIFQSSLIPQNSTVIPAEQRISEINSADMGMNSHSSSRPVHDLDKENTMNSLEIKQPPKPTSHDGRFYCDFAKCNKSFPKKCTLNRHKKTHSEGNCCCTCCGKKFHENSGLQRHMKTCMRKNGSQNLLLQEQKSTHNSQDVETGSDRLIETLPLGSTPSEEIKKSLSAPIFDNRTPELPVPLRPILQTPSVTLTAQPVTEVKIAANDKNSKKSASMTLRKQATSSYSRDAQILPIIAALKSAITLMLLMPATTPEQREYRMTFGMAGIRGVLSGMLPPLFPSKNQLDSKVSSITETIQPLLSMILPTLTTPELRELQITALMDLVKNMLSGMAPPMPLIKQEIIDLTPSGPDLDHSHPRPVSDNATLSKNLDSKYTPTIFSESAQHQQKESNSAPQTNVPKQATDISSPSQNPCALFQSLPTEKETVSKSPHKKAHRSRPN